MGKYKIEHVFPGKGYVATYNNGIITYIDAFYICTCFDSPTDQELVVLPSNFQCDNGSSFELDYEIINRMEIVSLLDVNGIIYHFIESFKNGEDVETAAKQIINSVRISGVSLTPKAKSLIAYLNEKFGETDYQVTGAMAFIDSLLKKEETL